jgi:hypothetical protein
MQTGRRSRLSTFLGFGIAFIVMALLFIASFLFSMTIFIIPLIVVLFAAVYFGLSRLVGQQGSSDGKSLGKKERD